MDIDGDGKAELAAGAGWNPSDTLNSGAVTTPGGVAWPRASSKIILSRRPCRARITD